MSGCYLACCIIKVRIHSSCEIEDFNFIETHLCKLCVILRSRELSGGVLIKDTGRRLPLELQQCNLYHGQQGDVNQSVRGHYKALF